MKKSAIVAAAVLSISMASSFAAEFSKETAAAPIMAGMLASNAEPTLRLGGYVGVLTNKALVDITLLRPWRQDFKSGLLVDAHAI